MKSRPHTTPVDPIPGGRLITAVRAVNGRSGVVILNAGDRVQVDGERGDFRFDGVVVKGEHVWVNVVGGPVGSVACRSFVPSRVRVQRIYRIDLTEIVDGPIVEPVSTHRPAVKKVRSGSEAALKAWETRRAKAALVSA